MHISLIVVGKLRAPALKALYEEYYKRLDWKLTVYEYEGKSALPHFSQCAARTPYLIALDEHGENLKSEEFAHLLENIQLHHQGKVTFVIGAAEGLPQEIKTKAQKTISFGKLTWPHLLVRVLLMEQLYRAQQILKGHPYHRE
ncbi:MAG: 23S rRNA (pseudouridine(1915)-N(3))-methyltransferase RlmH [Alphaproteobacteria bacterium]|nr:23S rRNA (pseudouridine(1915)-N(3))-methyltransferase RlmH [Alphaproteobacteria bacterium]